MPSANFGHSASVLDGLIYIVGAGTTRLEVLRFDPMSGVWSTLASTLNSQWGCSSFVLDGCLYAAGGAQNLVSSVECYDVDAETWTVAAANMHEVRAYFGAVTIGSVGPAEEQDLFDSLIAKATRRKC
jgi:hypothetical protein